MASEKYKFKVMITIYTDGACSGNPGIGGWGVVILENKKDDIFLNGGDDSTTNNKMELTAAIEALKFFKEKKEIKLITDSKYVKDGIQTWIHNWKKNGWKTAYKQPVKNKELWEELDLLNNEFEISWNWVKAHSTDKLNNEVDLIAREAANL